jgi:hypothetical protein
LVHQDFHAILSDNLDVVSAVVTKDLQDVCRPYERGTSSWDERGYTNVTAVELCPHAWTISLLRSFVVKVKNRIVGGQL